MSKNYSDFFGFGLEKISESSSPQPNKGKNSPKLPKRGRVHMGGFTDTYRSFFKIQNQLETPNLGSSRKVLTSQTLAQKQKVIQDLQQKILKQTVKKNSREKSYAERIKTNWRSKIQQFIIKLVRISLELAKKNHEVQKSALFLLHKCSQKKNRVEKLKVIMHWISLWLKPIFSMVSWICQKNVS